MIISLLTAFSIAIIISILIGRVWIKGTLEQERVSRESLEENKGKFVEVIYKREEDGHHLQIVDPGKGFNWKRHFNASPSAIAQSSGRGIMIAKAACFVLITK